MRIPFIFLTLLFFMLLPGTRLHAQQLLSLEKTLQIAMKNSPDIQSSLLDLEESQQSLNAQKAALKSQFSLSLDPLSYSRNRSFDDYYTQWYTNESFETSGTFTVAQPILWTDGTISLVDNFGWQRSKTEQLNQITEDKSFTNKVYVSLTQPLFTYNTLKVKLKTLELDLENARLSYALKKLSVEQQVTQYFYNVYMAQMELSIAQDEVVNTKKSYELTQNKVNAGLAAKEELYQAELNYATAKSDVENQRVNLENYKDQLKQYIGMDIYEALSVIADVDIQPVQIDLKKAIEDGLKNRMELRQYGIQIQTAQFDMLAVKASNEFKGQLGLSIGVTGNNSHLSDIYQNPTKNPSVSLSFNVPLFDWGEKKSRIRAQDAVIKQQQLNLGQEKVSIIVNIRQVYRTIQNDLTQIDIAKQNERNAKLTYDINLDRYANGDLTGMDLNQYQNQLSEAKKDYAQSLIDYKLELLDLKIQTLYDFQKQQPVIPFSQEMGKVIKKLSD